MLSLNLTDNRHHYFLSNKNQINLNVNHLAWFRTADFVVLEEKFP